MPQGNGTAEDVYLIHMLIQTKLSETVNDLLGKCLIYFKQTDVVYVHTGHI